VCVHKSLNWPAKANTHAPTLVHSSRQRIVQDDALKSHFGLLYQFLPLFFCCILFVGNPGIGKDILSLTQDILNIEITKGLIVMSNDYILHTYYTNTGCFATLVFCGTSQKTSGCLLLNNPLYPLYTLYTWNMNSFA